VSSPHAGSDPPHSARRRWRPTSPARRAIAARCSRRTATLPDRSVPHQRHQHARRGCCGREHDGYCESAQVRPVAPPVRGLRRTRHAVMHSMRGGVDVGRQGHGMHFSRCATTHHTRGDVHEPTVRPDRSRLCASGEPGSYGLIVPLFTKRAGLGGKPKPKVKILPCPDVPRDTSHEQCGSRTRSIRPGRSRSVCRFRTHTFQEEPPESPAG
jgi:hypothetical protein